MSAPDGRCAEHPDVAATFLCARCGDFGCDGCARRVTPSAQPLCGACWAQRERTAGELERSASRSRTYTMVIALSVFAAWFLFVLATCLFTG